MANVNIYLTSALTSSERRINGNWKLNHFMQKVEFITGIPPESQKISIYHLNSLVNLVDCKKLETDAQYLDSLKDLTLNQIIDSKENLKSDEVLVELSRIQVDDIRENSELKEIAQLSENPDIREKSFHLSDSDYLKKQDSVLRWKRENNLGRFDQNRVEQLKCQILENNRIAKTLQIGQRCNVTTNITNIITPENFRKGTVRFIGNIPEIPSAIRIDSDEENQTDFDIIWIGVELDEATGKNDGSIKGNSYFHCKPEHGVFVKALNVEIINEDCTTTMEDSDDDEL